MNSMLTIAILAGLGGMIGWGSADFFAKKTIDRMGPMISLVWAHMFGTAILLLTFLIQLASGHTHHSLPSHGSAWLGLAFFGVLQMVVYWLVYQGFEKGLVSVLNPVFASYSGLVALISFAFLGEHATQLAVVALVIIFAGNIWLNVDLRELLHTKRVKLGPGLTEVGLATVLAAFWTIGWDKFVNRRDAVTSALFMYAFMTLAAVLLAKALRTKDVTKLPSGKKFLFMMGLGEAVAYLAISWGYSRTSLTGVVALISGAFSVPTIILAYLFLKERLTRLQLYAIAVIIVGIVLVSVA